MPLSGGTAGAHDDSMHQGSAKRDALSGVAGLDALGNLLVLNGYIYLTKDISSNMILRERTSGEDMLKLARSGAFDYICNILESGVYKRVQTESMKDVVSGIAALDASGHLLIPSYRIYAARGASEQVTFRERTSDERMMRLIRNGANDYEGRMNVAGTEQRILTMRDLCVEEYSNHLGAVDNFTQTAVAGNGVAAADAANHEMDLSTGINAIGHSLFETKKTFTPGSQIVVANFILQNIVDGAVDNRCTYIGLKDDFGVIGPTNGVYFSQLTDGTWDVETSLGGISSGIAITALANGDHCTIVAKGTVTEFYVNHVLVGSPSRDMTAQTLKCGVSVHADNAGISAARSISVDMITVKNFV